MRKLVILIFAFYSCLTMAEDKTKTVSLLAQWHLAPKADTSDIKSSKELPQYRNQLAIFWVLKEWIEEGKVSAVVAEGCEGEITKAFSETFNSWNYKKLSKIKKDEQAYQDVLTHLPLKIEVLYSDEVYTLCGDELGLIDKHQLLLSDLRAYAGIWGRLKETENKDKKKFEKYAELLGSDVEDPVKYAAQKLREGLEKEEVLLNKRNQAFVKTISEMKEDKIAVVIGARHIEGLESDLKKKGYEVIVPKVIQETLPQEDLMGRLREILEE